MEPFYFKSYDRIVGKAETPEELLSEMKRLENTDPFCVEYHVSEGHISTWLKGYGMPDLAVKIEGTRDPKAVINILEAEIGGQAHSPQHRKGTRGGPHSGKRGPGNHRGMH
jgi:hypothetical protein